MIVAQIVSACEQYCIVQRILFSTQVVVQRLTHAVVIEMRSTVQEKVESDRL